MPPAGSTPVTRVLILGGTADAVTLATRLAERPGFAVTTSLAGVTRWSTPIPGEVLKGGFGGVAGLAATLGQRRIDRLVDATHPFAVTMGRHAVAAAAETGVPLIRLERPAWQPGPGDRWLGVADAAAAAEALGRQAGGRPTTAFLTIGRRGLEAFAPLSHIRFVVRMIEPPDRPLPLAHHELVLDRGPFPLAAERDLFARHAIAWLVAKNSGGDAVAPKLQAAREAGAGVIMIERPARTADATNLTKQPTR